MGPKLTLPWDAIHAGNGTTSKIKWLDTKAWEIPGRRT